MSPSPPKVMPKELQIGMLCDIVSTLNPGIDVVGIDWEHEIDPTLTFPENRLEFASMYPQYRWFKDETARSGVREEAYEKTKDYVSYILNTAVLPEAREDVKEIFKDYLRRYRWALDRRFKIAPLKKRIVQLEKSLKKTTEKEGKLKTRLEEEQRETVERFAKSPVRWGPRLERRLKDVFEATFRRAKLSPRRFWAEYRLELETIKTLPSKDDMVKAVEALANEIIRREAKPPKIRFPVEAPRPARRPPLPPELPPEEEEERFIALRPAEIPVYPEKPFIPSRLLTKSELDEFRSAFNSAVTLCGKSPYTTYARREFDRWIGSFLFSSWDQVKKNYTSLIEVICEEKALKPPPRALPYEDIERLVQWQVSLKTGPGIVWATKPWKHNTVEEVMETLETLGKPTRRADVIKAIQRGWKDKVPSFVSVPKGHLEKLIGEPLE